MVPTLIIIFLICIGFLIGKFAAKKALLIWNDHFINILLYFLLFSFGVGFGLEHELFAKLGDYGFEVFVLTLSGIFGSLLFSVLISLIYKRKLKTDEK